jgi:hypothetical protein
VSENGQLVRVDATTGAVTPLPNDGAATYAALAYDPVGVLYGTEAGGRVRAIDVASGETVDVLGQRDQHGVKPGKAPARLNDPGSIALLPNGDLLLFDVGESVLVRARIGN